MSKVLTIKNSHLKLLLKAISYPMTFQRGRIRNRFLKLLESKTMAFEKNRMEIVESCAIKDKKTGAPVIENGHYKIDTAKQKKFDKEFEVLIQENSVIDILPSTEKEIGDIKQIINDTPIQLGGPEIEALEEILLAFNNIAPLPEKKKGK